MKGCTQVGETVNAQSSFSVMTPAKRKKKQQRMSKRGTICEKVMRKNYKTESR